MPARVVGGDLGGAVGSSGAVCDDDGREEQDAKGDAAIPVAALPSSPALLLWLSAWVCLAAETTLGSVGWSKRGLPHVWQPFPNEKGFRGGAVGVGCVEGVGEISDATASCAGRRLLDDLSAAPRALVSPGSRVRARRHCSMKLFARTTRGLTMLEAGPSESELSLPLRVGRTSSSHTSTACWTSSQSHSERARRRAAGRASSATPARAACDRGGVRSAVLALSREAPVLVAIDDVQWLDAPTAAAVGSRSAAVRERVGLWCTRRAAMPLELERAAASSRSASAGPARPGSTPPHSTRRAWGASFSHSELRRI